MPEFTYFFFFIFFLGLPPAEKKTHTHNKTQLPGKKERFCRGWSVALGQKRRRKPRVTRETQKEERAGA